MAAALMSTDSAAPSLVFLAGVLLLCWRGTRRPLFEQKKLSSSKDLNAALDLELPVKYADNKTLLSGLAILIPARNEAANLPSLLQSLKIAQEQGARVLVIDDQSTDGTAQIAHDMGFEVCTTAHKPEGWSGKNWACAEGFEFLKKTGFTGQHLLFTDADTNHEPQKLRSLLSWFDSEQAALMTALPKHRNPELWERLMGPFQLIVLMITNAMQSKPSAERFFSIGQFLLFRRRFYEQIGGHFSVKSELAEDLALAKICFESNEKFIVYSKTDLYSTRMYASLGEFVAGWQRNFRLGMPYSSLQTWVETVIVIAAILGTWTWPSYIFTVLIFLFFQRKQGRFSMFGALFYPVSVVLFIFISLKASLSTLRKKPILWKAREYSITKLGLLIFILSSLHAPTTRAAQTEKNTVIITIEGLKSGAGGIELSLFDQAHEKAYPVDPKKSVAQVYKDLQGSNKIDFVFDNLPEGEYAAFAYHDEDGNKKINTNFVGIPSEGYGATSGAKNKFGPPKFSDAKFLVGKNKAQVEGSKSAAETSVSVKIEY